MPHDEIAVAKLLRSKGLRVTDQRLLVLDGLCATNGHATAGAVVRSVREADPSIDQSTVHRTLDLFVKLGVASVGLSGGERVYEIVGRVPHHHLVCRACGRDTELAHDALAPLLESLAREHRFTVTAAHVMLEGLCAACGPPARPRPAHRPAGRQ